MTSLIETSMSGGIVLVFGHRVLVFCIRYSVTTNHSISYLLSCETAHSQW